MLAFTLAKHPMLVAALFMVGMVYLVHVLIPLVFGTVEQMLGLTRSRRK